MNVSTERIATTIEGLCRFENRIAGTKTERAAADYLKGLLSDIGYDVIEHEFPILAWEPQKSRISLVSPEVKHVDCALFPNSPSVTHRVNLVDMESKQEEKPSELPTYGITEWGDSLLASPGIPYDRALDQGLDGLIISSPDEGELLKVRVGSHGKPLQIPIISVSKETGESLKMMMEESEVILDIDCVATRGPSNSYNLEATLEGSHPDFDIIVSAHYDAWFSGAADNAAPVAIVIEVARQLWKYVQQGGILRRTVRFLLFGAEEGGSERVVFWLNGSRNYVENQEALNQFALIVNLDSIGYEATNYVAATHEILDFSKSVSTALKQEGRFSHYGPPANGSDHWFFTIAGVPTIYLISWPSHLYHTQKDKPEFLDFESIQAYAEYVLHSMMEFSNAEALPLDVMTLIEFMNERINEFKQIEGSPFGLQEASDSLIGILELRSQLEDFSRRAAVDRNEKHIAELNRFLVTTAGRMNRTIGAQKGAYQANYLSRLDFIQEYMTIDSVIRTLEEMPLMKIHPRTLASLREHDDAPNGSVDVVSTILELRRVCNEFGAQIDEEIATVISCLKETQSDLERLLT